MSAPPHLPGSYLVVELTNRCSLACVHCSVSEGSAHPHHARSGYLDPRLALALFEDLEAMGARFDTLILFWLGEPLLHPHFGEIWRAALRVAVRAGTFGRVEVHTNATHLDERRIRTALNAAEVDQPWHLSLDAVDPGTYRAVKGRDRLDRVTANIDALLDAKAATGAPWPRPVFQFIVGSNNVAEAGRFRERWEGACRARRLRVRAAAGAVPPGDDAVVFFRQLDCPTAAEQERQNAIFRAEMAAQGLALPDRSGEGDAVRPVTAVPGRATPCSGFWKSPVVGWQGDVTVCTRDNRFDNRIGNLSERRFRDLWWGATMAGRRVAVARGDYSGLPLCQRCFIPSSLNYSALSPADVAVQAAWDTAHVPAEAAK